MRPDLQIPYVVVNFIYMRSECDTVDINGALGFFCQLTPRIENLVVQLSMYLIL